VKYISIFRFQLKNGGSFIFFVIFQRKNKIFFSYFYFTAEKVKSIFGRPLRYNMIVITDHIIY